MHTPKLRVGVVFGGRSGEHEISLLSARSVVAALDRSKYDLTLLGIDRDGRWRHLEEAEFQQLTSAALPVVQDQGDEVAPLPVAAEPDFIERARHTPLARLDVVFPVLHGPYGEDGCVQGLLELADLPYVGAGLLGSAVGMDKDVQKRLLRDAGLPLLPFFVTTRGALERDPGLAARQAEQLGYPVFVKPANLGSSVGVSKVDTPDELAAAVADAASYDEKIVLERGIAAREIECAVLGNADPIASIPGEIRPNAEFYSYEAKYVDGDGASLLIPAELSPEQTRHVQELSIRVFQVLEGAGMARVDFLLDRNDGGLYVNELNSIPGFTTISMYPKLWEHSGLAYPALLDRLIELALERHARRRRLRRSFRLGS